MAFNLQPGIAKGLATKSSSSPKTLLLHDKALVEKEAYVPAGQSLLARESKTTAQILVAQSKDWMPDATLTNTKADLECREISRP